MPHPPSQRLIVFTRYPIPGEAKTRLIPRLGPEGAADLQRRMTERLVRRTRDLAGRPNAAPLSVEVRFEGGDVQAMREWLGGDLAYRPQGAGNLGDRLDRALREAIAEGHEKALVVGSDIPDLTGEIIAGAFEALGSRDLAIGPAADGGYYLIGLKRPAPDLFRDMPWGTEAVLRRTLEKAETLGLSVRLLQTLRDLDRPEDLEIWEESPSSGKWGLDSAQRVCSRASTFLSPISKILHDSDTRKEEAEPTSPPSPKCVSVIIPTLDEEENIGPTLEKVWKNQKGGLSYPHENAFGSNGAVEAVVVDGGSRDETVAAAKAHGARVASSEPGRGAQMNAGAAMAKGEILLFLHADTHPPEGYDEMARETLARPGVAAGAFEFRVDSLDRRYRRLERMVNWRARRLQMPYGDQGIFLRASLFREIGGYGDLPIMEDFDLVRRLKRHGSVVQIPRPILTSARRWREIGIWRAACLNVVMVAGYYAGVSPARLARLYYGRKGTSHG